MQRQFTTDSAEKFIDHATEAFQATIMTKLGPAFRARSKSWDSVKFLNGRKTITPATVVLDEQTLISGGVFQGLTFNHECPTERSRLVIGIGATIRAGAATISNTLYRQLRALLNMNVSQGGQSNPYGLGYFLASDAIASDVLGVVAGSDRSPLTNVVPLGAGWHTAYPMAALSSKETLRMEIPQIAVAPTAVPASDTTISLVLQTVDFVQQ